MSLVYHKWPVDKDSKQLLLNESTNPLIDNKTFKTTKMKLKPINFVLPLKQIVIKYSFDWQTNGTK